MTFALKETAMRRCILHVTDHEYDQILQLSHDAVLWDTRDRALLEGLRAIVGQEAADRISAYDQCRMQKHNWLEGPVRVEEDATEQATSPGFSG
jgi:hypothetical protein